MIGNYLTENNRQLSRFGFPKEARKSMIILIEQIHDFKSYRESTLYLAVNIADRYLQKLATDGSPAPQLELLAVVSVLLAAKYNEPMLPNFNNMVIMMYIKFSKRIEQKDLIDLERQILIKLDF